MRIHSAAIRYFDAVRRAGSVREAARHLNVASSAVNRQILKLEEEVGTPLFERRPQGMRLTASGEILARHILNVIQDAERTQSELAALKGARIGHVALATTEGVAFDMMPAVLTNMRNRYPRIMITIRTMPSSAVPKAIIQGDADLGFAFSANQSPDLQQLANARFVTGAVVAPGHPLADRPFVTFDECARFPLILPTSEASLSPALLALRRRAQELDSPIVDVNSILLMKHLALTGIGIAFQTRIGLEPDIRAGRLRHIPLGRGQPLLSELSILAKEGRRLPLAAMTFLHLFVEELQNWQDAP
jgi:DNA-binding transcriptional LysR family regulator